MRVEAGRSDFLAQDALYNALHGEHVDQLGGCSALGRLDRGTGQRALHCLWGGTGNAQVGVSVGERIPGVARHLNRKFSDLLFFG
jgi:hypothetical protein